MIWAWVAAASLAAPPELGAGVGLFIPAGDHPLAQPGDLVRPAQLAPLVGTRASGFAHEFLGVEAELDLGYGATAAGGAGLVGARGQVHVRGPGEEIWAGAVAGLGALGAVGPGGDVPPFEAAYHGGFAVSARLVERAWLRFDLRAYRVPGSSAGQRFGASALLTRARPPAEVAP